MDRDEVWRTIDQQRAELADLMESFTDADWETPSLCEGWRVREVGAHLTLAQTGLLEALRATVRARGNFNRMIHETAVRQAERPVAEYPAALRAMIGSRRKAPFVSDLEPLIDQLVHGQDMLVPLGRTREMPHPAAAAAAQRAWDLNWPFGVKKQVHGFSLSATDHQWSVGLGEVVEGPIRALLMLVTGRLVVLPELGGPGADELRARLQPSRVS
jgi:uncharacterized protein (TIGR03083 family)